MSWWDELDADRSDDRRKAERLANVISRLGGSRDDKVKFLVVEMAHMEAEAEREGHRAGSLQFGGAMKSLAHRYWRQELRRRPQLKEFAEESEPKTTQEEWKQMAADFRAKREKAGV
jgi:hypothetical protein